MWNVHDLCSIVLKISKSENDNLRKFLKNSDEIILLIKYHIKYRILRTRFVVSKKETWRCARVKWRNSRTWQRRSSSIRLDETFFSWIFPTSTNHKVLGGRREWGKSISGSKLWLLRFITGGSFMAIGKVKFVTTSLKI